MSENKNKPLSAWDLVSGWASKVSSLPADPNTSIFFIKKFI